MQRLDLYFQMFGYAHNNFEVLSSFITREKSCFYKTVETAKGKHEDYVGLTDKEKESKKASYAYYNDIYNRNVPDCDYVKTVNADFSCKEYGIVPKTYVELINQIFNSGIRFWHSTAMKFILTEEDFKDIVTRKIRLFPINFNVTKTKVCCASTSIGRYIGDAGINWHTCENHGNFRIDIMPQNFIVA